MSENFWAFTCKTCGHRNRWQGASHPVPPCQKCHPKTAPQPAGMGVNITRKSQSAPAATITANPSKPGISVETGDSRYDEAQEIIGEINELIEQMPERGMDFAESAGETVSGIAETIEQRGDATQSQIVALQNIRDGLARWVRK